MSIQLTPEQQNAIEQAIQFGLVANVDEFIDSALTALPQRRTEHDQQRARAAVARIRELRQGVTLDLQGESFRKLAHTGHKY